MIQDHSDHGTRYMKGIAESLSREDSAVPLMRHDLSDPSDLGSPVILIGIIPKERTYRESKIHRRVFTFSIRL